MGTYIHTREYARINRYANTGRRTWAVIFDDWDYGDEYESRESIDEIGADQNGNAYCVTDAKYSSGDSQYSYCRVIKISNSGVRLWTFEQELTTPPDRQHFIAVAESGFSVFVFNDGHIIALSASGDELWQNTTFFDIKGLKIGGDGFIYVYDNSGVHKLTTYGVVLWSTAIGGDE